MLSQPLPRIVKLEEAVINRIAAGEVVQRPANAIKELLENSLDAGSTNVQIVIKQGGLKLLQIQDNGHGIAEADMPLVCERFTTSKLRKFEDLSHIATFGFRGEALASISHVARVTITTKTTDSQCAYKATFLDGKMTSELAFCAGNTGTQIMAEDVFYNMATRRSALQNFAEETRRICEVVQKYAVHNSKVAISLRRFDENIPDVRTSGGANSQNADAIRSIYGNDVAKNLLPEIVIEDPKLAFSARCLCTSANYAGKKFFFLLFINNRLVECANLKRSLEQIYNVYLPKNTSPFIYISLSIAPQNLDVNVHPTKQQVHFLFEDEIVEMIKRSIDSALACNNSSRSFHVETFSSSTPKLNLISEERKLRTTTPLVTGTLRPSSSSTSSAPAQHSIIRVDSSQQKLDRFFNSKQPSRETAVAFSPRIVSSSFDASIAVTESSEVPQKTAASNETETQSVLNKLNDDIIFYTESKDEQKPNNEVVEDEILLNSAYEMVVDDVGKDENVKNRSAEKAPPPPRLQSAPVSVPKAKQLPDVTVKVSAVCRADSAAATGSERTFRKRNLQLDSVNSLKEEVENNCHDGISRIFGNFAFVGCLDYNHSLIQHDARLLMVNNTKLSTEFFYQELLANFGNMGFVRFKEPLSIKELALIALNSPHSGWKEADGPKEDLAVFTRDFLISKSQMLLDYFSIDIDPESGCLVALPLIITDYSPNFSKLPFFLLKLASDVNWDTEKDCFRTMCMEIAKFYAIGGAPYLSSPANDALNDVSFKKTLEHAVFLQIKQQILSTFFPSKELSECGSVVELTSLHELYKVFERC